MKLSYDERYYNNVKKQYGVYTLTERVGPQEIWFELAESWYKTMGHFNNSGWFNIALSIYNKTKDMYDNMDKKISTGLDPIRNVIIARKMFDAIEAYIVKKEAVNKKRDIYIYCGWEDNRRRDAYYRVLSKKGYSYVRGPGGHKVIGKKFKWKDYQEMVEENE